MLGRTVVAYGTAVGVTLLCCSGAARASHHWVLALVERQFGAPLLAELDVEDKIVLALRFADLPTELL